MVLTSHNQLGDTGRKTGFWLTRRGAVERQRVAIRCSIERQRLLPPRERRQSASEQGLCDQMASVPQPPNSWTLRAGRTWNQFWLTKKTGECHPSSERRKRQCR